MAERYPDHHGRLLKLEDDPAVLAEAVEMARCWFEREYDAISPEEWIEFAAIHEWRDRRWVYETLRLLSQDIWEAEQRREYLVTCREKALATT